ncbi:Endothelin-converting enzyme 1 [Nymphon striatum]|nr:Endothelin-converting enzyme 1 [Nymphon striatum]
MSVTLKPQSRTSIKRWIPYKKLKDFIFVAILPSLAVASESNIFLLSVGYTRGKYEKKLYRDGDKTKNAMRLRELNEIAPQIDWVAHLNALFNLNMNENSTVIVINPKFMTLIGNLTINTDKRDIANYLLWTVTFRNLQMLGPCFTELKLRYDIVTSGISELKSQDEYCVGETGGPLAYALSGMFVTKFFDKDSKYKVKEIADDYLKLYKKLVSKQKWMDKNTRKAAVEKVSAMKAYIGYPDELTDVNKINNITSNVDDCGSSFDNNGNQIFGRYRYWNKEDNAV